MLCLVLVLWMCVDVGLLYFFFKQKTAYEMRISDWSSDVCSSDLEFMASGHFQRHIRRMRRAALSRLNTLLSGWPTDVAGVGQLPTVAAGLHLTEIGRASCRERGCQYV